MSCGLLPTSWASCATDIAGKVAHDIFQSIATSFGDAADHALSWLWSQLNEATSVHLGGVGFDTELGIVAAITGVIAVALFVLQVVRSALRRDPGGLGRAFKGLVVAFVGGGAAITVLDGLLGATDQLSQGVVQLAAGTDIAGLGRLLIGAGTLASMASGPAGLILLSLGCIVASLVVYAALVVRKVLIVVTAVFAPLAFAGSLADLTVNWTRRWIETTLALVLSKLVLVLIFVAGYAILVEGAGQTGSGATQRVTQVISGLVVLCLAGFAPWLALKLVHFTGEQAHQLHALGGVAVGGVSSVGRSAQKAAPYVRRAHTPPAAHGASGGHGSLGSVVPGGTGSGTGPRGSGGPGGDGRGAGSASGGPRGGERGPRSPGGSNGPSSPGNGGRSVGGGRPGGGGGPGSSGAPNKGGSRETRTSPGGAGAPRGEDGAHLQSQARPEDVATLGRSRARPSVANPHAESRGGESGSSSGTGARAGASSYSRSTTERPLTTSAPEASLGERALSEPGLARSAGESATTPGRVQKLQALGPQHASASPGTPRRRGEEDGNTGPSSGIASPSSTSPQRARPLSQAPSATGRREAALSSSRHRPPTLVPESEPRGAEPREADSAVRVRPTSSSSPRPSRPAHPSPSKEDSL